jgi:1-aminocyclopropane-1-carboxylate deaminase
LLFPPTPVEPFRFEGRGFYVKRDDLAHPRLSGNKYRKLHTLLQTPSDRIDRVVSYGGVQSNAMLAIAALCHLKGWAFEYTAKNVPLHLKADPTGNYLQALSLGMRLNEVHPMHYEAAVAALLHRGCADARTVLVPQGGADVAAREGIAMLAGEIRAWKKRMGIEALTVATPAGTGTTAAFLAEALGECDVVTVPVVGDAAYLEKQIGQLMALPENLTILSTGKAYRFGTPDADLLRMYERLKDAGIVFDLLYAPVMWTALLENSGALRGEILYVHSGGTGGNETMLARYERLKV